MKTAAIILISLTAWFAVILQFVINKGTTTNFFSYFTILSNILVAIVSTILLFPSTSKLGKFAHSASTQTAVTLYIFIVGLVYNLVLRGIWVPKGYQLLADNLLHVATPLLFVFYWGFFIPKENLKWRDGLVWLIFPALYLLYSLIRGSIVHWYPYPFLDLDRLSTGEVAINVGMMILAFLVSGMTLIWISAMILKSQKD